ncbi:MAG: hypothetical protein Q7S86_04310, partial [bacterium]|nr:hypothetical protein [bacterium]
SLEVVSNKSLKIRQFIQQSLATFDLVVGQGNRPDRMHTQLVEWGVIPPFDYFFTGSRVGAQEIAKNWVEREVVENLEEQMPYIWDSPTMWGRFFELLDSNKDKKIIVISSSPRKEHERLAAYPNMLLASPTPKLAVRFEYDKRYMEELYNSIGMEYRVCNYASSEAIVNGYKFHAEKLESGSLVVQAAQGSGGVTMKSSTQAFFFVTDEKEFQYAIRALVGEGPLRIMKKYDGIPSNSAGLALPFGTFISAIPTVKPCGIVELGARSGTSGGNQWDTRFPTNAIDSQFEQLGKVGSKMADSGFYGVFGLDPIMPLVSNGEVFNSEINARSQGPDPQRAWAANHVGIPSLEEMQLAFYLGCTEELFPRTEDYNLVTRWLKIPPYLKLFPKKNQVVINNLNGYWNWQNGLVKASSKNASFKISGAPYPRQKIAVSSPDNFLYIKFLNVDMKIYTDEEKPRLTPRALKIVNYLYANI